jgi:hypothetical protein
MVDVSMVAELGTLSVLRSVDVWKPSPLPFESRLKQPDRTNDPVIARSKVRVLFID